MYSPLLSFTISIISFCSISAIRGPSLRIIHPHWPRKHRFSYLLHFHHPSLAEHVMGDHSFRQIFHLSSLLICHLSEAPLHPFPAFRFRILSIFFSFLSPGFLLPNRISRHIFPSDARHSNNCSPPLFLTVYFPVRSIAFLIRTLRCSGIFIRLLQRPSIHTIGLPATPTRIDRCHLLSCSPLRSRISVSSR